MPTKTKGEQMMEQRLFSWQLRKGTLKLSDCWWSPGANKDQGKTDTGETPSFIAARRRHIEVARLLVESGANKDIQRPRQD